MARDMIFPYNIVALSFVCLQIPVAYKANLASRSYKTQHGFRYWKAISHARIFVNSLFHVSGRLFPFSANRQLTCLHLPS